MNGLIDGLFGARILLSVPANGDAWLMHLEDQFSFRLVELLQAAFQSLLSIRAVSDNAACCIG